MGSFIDGLGLCYCFGRCERLVIQLNPNFSVVIKAELMLIAQLGQKTSWNSITGR